MKPKRFLHVGFTLPLPVSVKQLEPVFDKGSDWIRYSTNCWILHTNIGLATWIHRIKAVPGLETAFFFICEFDSFEADGWLPLEYWDWIKERRL